MRAGYKWVQNSIHHKHFEFLHCLGTFGNLKQIPIWRGETFSIHGISSKAFPESLPNSDLPWSKLNVHLGFNNLIKLILNRIVGIISKVVFCVHPETLSLMSQYSKICPNLIFLIPGVWFSVNCYISFIFSLVPRVAHITVISFLFYFLSLLWFPLSLKLLYNFYQIS